MSSHLSRRQVLMALTGAGLAARAHATQGTDDRPRRLLYVASPGVRNYVEWGGVGVLVYAIDEGHRLLRRIPTFRYEPGQSVENVKGICASSVTRRLYVSTIRRLACLDLTTDRLLWNREYEGGCDRMALSPDGAILYLPSLEKEHWHAVDARTGDVLARVVTNSGAHNTVYGPNGREVYLAGLRSPYLHVADPRTHTARPKVGPFSAPIRPFTINGSQSLCYVNVNDLLGFEVGDLRSGRKLHRVEVPGYFRGPVKRHGCPSHGIGLTPDESELWVTDAHNQALHLFDPHASPPRYVRSLQLWDQPGWITFSLRGDYAYPSTGEVISTREKQVVTQLRDEAGRPVQSEKMVEIDFRDETPVRHGDQFGIGRRRG